MRYRIKHEDTSKDIVNEFDVVILFDNLEQIRRTVTYINQAYEFVEKNYPNRVKRILAARVAKVGESVTFDNLELEKVPDNSNAINL